MLLHKPSAPSTHPAGRQDSRCPTNQQTVHTLSDGPPLLDSSSLSDLRHVLSCLGVFSRRPASLHRWMSTVVLVAADSSTSQRYVGKVACCFITTLLRLSCSLSVRPSVLPRVARCLRTAVLSWNAALRKGALPWRLVANCV